MEAEWGSEQEHWEAKEELFDLEAINGKGDVSGGRILYIGELIIIAMERVGYCRVHGEMTDKTLGGSW